MLSIIEMKYFNILICLKTNAKIHDIKSDDNLLKDDLEGLNIIKYLI